MADLGSWRHYPGCHRFGLARTQPSLQHPYQLGFRLAGDYFAELPRLCVKGAPRDPFWIDLIVEDGLQLLQHA